MKLIDRLFLFCEVTEIFLIFWVFFYSKVDCMIRRSVNHSTSQSVSATDGQKFPQLARKSANRQASQPFSESVIK